EESGGWPASSWLQLMVRWSAHRRGLSGQAEGRCPGRRQDPGSKAAPAGRADREGQERPAGRRGEPT
ncbi:hypothetical protein C1T14_26655, partial [Escherichia coli]